MFNIADFVVTYDTLPNVDSLFCDPSRLSDIALYTLTLSLG